MSELTISAADREPEPGRVSPAWTELRRYTAARIALGRSGGSLPTREALAFAWDQALARDAVHHPFDPAALATALHDLPSTPEISVLTSAAPDRTAYLRSPQLGRRLSAHSAAELAALRTRSTSLTSHDTGRREGSRSASIIIIVSDGLSALAAERQAPALLRELLPQLQTAGFTVAPLCVVRHGRVGLIDEIGAGLGADFALMLLGERPGLGTPDSLSAYFTFAPGPGRTDADRNCVSNIRPAGLSPANAALKLTAWLVEARTQKLSGVHLKEPTEATLRALRDVPRNPPLPP